MYRLSRLELRKLALGSIQSHDDDQQMRLSNLKILASPRDPADCCWVPLAVDPTSADGLRLS
jgi:hypothetical protein